jgi:hypothetical protein
MDGKFHVDLQKGEHLSVQGRVDLALRFINCWYSRCGELSRLKPPADCQHSFTFACETSKQVESLKRDPIGAMDRLEQERRVALKYNTAASLVGHDMNPASRTSSQPSRNPLGVRGLCDV